MKQLNTFAADDLALCRDHSKAVHEQFIDPTTPEDLRWHTEYTNHWIAVSRFERGVHMPTDLPLPPTYWDDLEHWTKTLAPAKPATPQPEPAAEVWHDGPPPVAGVYWAESKPAECAPGMFLRHFNGVMWSRHWRAVAPADFAATRRDGEHTASCEQISWFRLVEADKPAETAAPAAATHSVCIKAHHNLAGSMNHVGDVIEYGPASRHVPECWLPCDKAGWVSHVPTADSGCPVPSGVKFDTLRRSGYVCLFGETPPYAWELGFRHSRTASPGDIVAWRPTGVAA